MLRGPYRFRCRRHAGGYAALHRGAHSLRNVDTILGIVYIVPSRDDREWFAKRVLRYSPVELLDVSSRLDRRGAGDKWFALRGLREGRDEVIHTPSVHICTSLNPAGNYLRLA